MAALLALTCRPLRRPRPSPEKHRRSAAELATVSLRSFTVPSSASTCATWRLGWLPRPESEMRSGAL